MHLLRLQSDTCLCVGTSCGTDFQREEGNSGKGKEQTGSISISYFGWLWRERKICLFYSGSSPAQNLSWICHVLHRVFRGRCLSVVERRVQGGSLTNMRLSQSAAEAALKIRGSGDMAAKRTSLQIQGTHRPRTGTCPMEAPQQSLRLHPECDPEVQ